MENRRYRILGPKVDTKFLDTVNLLGGTNPGCCLSKDIYLDIFYSDISERKEKEFEKKTKLFSYSNKGGNEALKIIADNNLSVGISIEKEGNLFLNRISIKEYPPANRQPHHPFDILVFEMLSSNIVISPKELKTLLGEYFAPYEKQIILEESRVNENERKRDKMSAKIDEKNEEEILKAQKKEEGRRKKSWPSIKKEMDEMNRRAGIVKQIKIPDKFK